jgi:peptide-methionine (S)-S-oxide reductase
MRNSRTSGGTLWLVYSMVVAAISVPAIVGGQSLFTFIDRGKIIAAPAVDEPAGKAASKVAVFAGGCFWGVQGVYQHVKGVTSAVSGYAGGGKGTAQYELVETGTTGHAEAVQVVFDPHQISYGRLLQIYFSVVHDPTQLDRQGPDVGPQYRSAIFPLNAAQAKIARAYITQLGETHVFNAPIVTKVEIGQSFYAAETHHQDFLTRNPRNQYIVVNDLPKINNLKRLFPDAYRQEPSLVLASR